MELIDFENIINENSEQMIVISEKFSINNICYDISNELKLTLSFIKKTNDDVLKMTFNILWGDLLIIKYHVKTQELEYINSYDEIIKHTLYINGDEYFQKSTLYELLSYETIELLKLFFTTCVNNVETQLKYLIA